MSPWHSRSLSAVDSLICGSDFIKMKVYQQSNTSPPPTSGRHTSNPADGAAQRSGMASPWGAHWSFAPELSGARRRGVFGAKRHRGRRDPYPGRNAVGNGSKVPHGGVSPPPSMDNGEWWFRCSSSFKKQLNTFLMASSCFSRRRISSSGGGAVAHDGG
jgi:hypothetical protein